MKAIILAAGLGKRIPKISKKIPKGLININGKTLLKRQIDFFKSYKIKDIGIVRGYKANKIKYKNIHYFNNKNFRKNEQLDSFFYAKKFFDDAIIVSFSDIIYEKKILDDLLKDKNEFAIAVEKNWKKRYEDRFDHPVSQADKVCIRNGKIKKIGKRINVKDANGEFLGIFKFSSNYGPIFTKKYKEIKKSQNTKKLQIHDFFNYLIKKKIVINASYVKGKYMEIDTFNDYQIAKREFK